MNTKPATKSAKKNAAKVDLSKTLITEGSVINLHGYTFTVSDISWEDFNGQPCARFTGTCTDDKHNDSIRRSSYNKARYGGTNYRAA